VLDLGVGTGLLALALAPAVERVYGLDASPAMLARFRANADARKLDNVQPLLGDLRSLPLPDESITLAVSNYTFHHVPDTDKELALSEVRRVLRPGGRLVVCDMMFTLSLDGRDRRIVLEKTLAIARRGPAGIVRLARNAARVALGRWEHPAREETWERMLRARHFEEIDVRLLRHEAGVATAVRPER
jgi:ubiquinone/menaquinone biosynthesis C-methylase UbiE